MGFLELLTLLFIAFKLFHVVSWSWWLVFSPELVAIIGYAIVYLFFGAAILGFIKFFFGSKKSKRPSF